VNNIIKNLLLALTLVCAIAFIVFCVQLIVQNRGVEPINHGLSASESAQQDGDEDSGADENGDDSSGDDTGDDTGTDNDTGDTGETEVAGWPKELPAYPDGEIDYLSERDKGSYTITIINTSKASMAKYTDTLTQAGWEIDFETEDGKLINVLKGDRSVNLMLRSDGTTLTITLGDKIESEQLPNEWPAALLPSGFPEYPEGTIVYVALTNTGSVSIDISGSSEKAMDAYKGTLEKAGWEFDTTDSVSLVGKKDGLILLLTFSAKTEKINIFVG